MKAIQVQKPGHAAIVDVPVPSLPSPDYLLIKTVAVALNPTDWKHIRNEPGPVIVGCDFSGIVTEVGSNLISTFQKGDKVWSAIHGCNPLVPESGAFGEYLIAKGTLVNLVPKGMSFEETAALGVGVVTVGQGLYQAMGLPFPDAPLKKKSPILIYGGSSASGALGIQFAKLSGFEVLTTCSPSNFDYVKSLGADAVFDYNSPTAVADILAYTSNKIYYIWDTIGTPSSYTFGAAVLKDISPPEGQILHYGTILPPPEAGGFSSAVKVTFTLGYSAQGAPFKLGPTEFPARPEDYEFMVTWMKTAQKLLEARKWKPHRQEVREGGLEGVLEGLEDLKEGRVSGVKLVYRIGES